MSNVIIKELQLLSTLNKSSPQSFRSSEIVLLLAFESPKPLFSTAGPAQIVQAFNKSIPNFTEAFKRLTIKISPDLVHHAQRCCSGIQFIIDELPEGTQISDLSTLTEGPISVLKEYIRNCIEEGIQPENPSLTKPLSAAELSTVPQNHWWCYLSAKSDSESE